jgi:hypothetical protein
LNALDNISPNTVSSMWKNNFLLQRDDIDREAVRAILRPPGKNEMENEDYYAHCRDAYRMEVLDMDPMYTDQPPKNLQTDL